VLERAGDVIPQVVGPLADLRTGAETEWTMPPECPVCGSAVTLVSEKGSDVAYCLNATCQGQVLTGPSLSFPVSMIPRAFIEYARFIFSARQ
jgi:NAD-dependent DNA ligase